FRNSDLLKTRTYLGLLTPCLALHGSQRFNLIFKLFIQDNGSYLSIILHLLLI
ncbi:hypothetical protein K661_00726, partial [Piscirickettsia salmonis LF-89 = ATCC VR-1361]